MIKKLLFLVFSSFYFVAISQDDLVQHANPLMGTDSEFSLSNGNTYPAIAVPWGMNFWTPMTSKMGDGWTYKYDENQIRGFKQTHQPSPWINDYAAFSIMPISGKIAYHEEDRQSWFSHKAETVLPHYYRVYLADYDVTTELSPTERAVHFSFTFPENDSSYIVIDGFDMGSHVKIILNENKIVGYCRNNHGGVPDNFHNYFVAEFDKPFEEMYVWQDSMDLVLGGQEAEGNHVGAVIGFKTKRGEKVTVKMASSFISLEQAELNLKNEIGDQSFETTKQKAYDTWNKEFNRIKVSGGSMDDIRTFYSCLYRLLLFPRKFYEYNSDGKVVHYSPYNGKVLPGYMFTDNGFWDTFRAVFPYFTIMYPELDAQIMQGLVNTYKESGWLPEWASPGHRNCMVGSNSACLIADAYMKGITDFDADVLMEAIIKGSQINEGRPMTSVGREGVDYYKALGYVPYDVGIHENAARTLEYAFADFAAGKMADKMGKKTEAEQFYNSAMNYKNLYDSETGWMRGKNKNGKFQSPFNPLKWGDAFTEGNSLHYTWSVLQDVQGLVDLMGGKKKFVDKLDRVFTMPPDYDDSYYGFTIHEIREMQIANMGNYAHGNQPIQHMIYLYNYAGASHKTQEKVRDVMERMYQPTPDGYCGDEDNGQTSAWYVFSAMGFYPVTPGTAEYVIGSPLFNKIELELENGRSFTINAPANDKDNIYIQSMNFNGKAYNNTYLNHVDIIKGGVIEFNMTNQPNTEWGSGMDAAPFSMSKKK